MEIIIYDYSTVKRQTCIVIINVKKAAEVLSLKFFYRVRNKLYYLFIRF